MKDIITPLGKTLKQTKLLILLSTCLGLLFTWAFIPIALLPKPAEVVSCFADLWRDGLGAQLITSYMLNVQAIFWSLLFSLSLSYLSTIPVFKPLVTMSTSLRFLSMVGLSLAFQVAFTNPHTVKVALLTFSISVWFINGMLDVIDNIPAEQYDLARTLRMGDWRVLWEVVVLGTADKVFDVLRQTAAIGWMMLTMVECIVFSEGGVGTVLQTMQKHMRLGDIMAIQLCICILGMTQDYLIGFVKTQFCPYAAEKK